MEAWEHFSEKIRKFENLFSHAQPRQLQSKTRLAAFWKVPKPTKTTISKIHKIKKIISSKDKGKAFSNRLQDFSKLLTSRRWTWVRFPWSSAALKPANPNRIFNLCAACFVPLPIEMKNHSSPEKIIERKRLNNLRDSLKHTKVTSIDTKHSISTRNDL